MTQTTKIGNLEGIFLIATVMMNHIILNFPKTLLNTTGSGSILNVIFITLIALGLAYFIYRLFKNFPNQDILDASEFLGGKILKYIIGILFIVYFLFFASIFLRSFCESLKIIFFPRTPVIVLIILFIVGMVMSNKLGMHSIIRANLMFMPLILLSIIVIFFANMERFMPQRIFPIIGNGMYSTFFSGISNLFAFSGITLLYFIPPQLKDSLAFKKIALSSVLLSGIWLLFSVATLQFIFPSLLTTDEILPLYLASRFIEFGRFFQRLDAIFVFIWIISMTSYLSILLSFAISTFKKITTSKYPYILVYIGAIIIFLVSLVPQNYSQVRFLETTIYKYFVFFASFILSPIILILANLKYKRLHKQDAKQ